MNNLFSRIIILSLAGFGVYKMFPQVSGPVDYYVKNPQFQQSGIIPAINTANKILPSKLQIPLPEVLGTETSSLIESPLKNISDQISQSVASAAAQQIMVIKNAATNQVCQALLEKLKSECGQ